MQTKIDRAEAVQQLGWRNRQLEQDVYQLRRHLEVTQKALQTSQHTTVRTVADLETTCENIRRQIAQVQADIAKKENIIASNCTKGSQYATKPKVVRRSLPSLSISSTTIAVEKSCDADQSPQVQQSTIIPAIVSPLAPRPPSTVKQVTATSPFTPQKPVPPQQLVPPQQPVQPVPPQEPVVPPQEPVVPPQEPVVPPQEPVVPPQEPV
eukprot:PhF_6_TR29061/c0_g1_i1/m.42345